MISQIKTDSFFSKYNQFLKVLFSVKSTTNLMNTKNKMRGIRISKNELDYFDYTYS